RIALLAAATVADAAVEQLDGTIDDLAYGVGVVDREREGGGEGKVLAEQRERRARQLDVGVGVTDVRPHADGLEDAGLLDGTDERLGHARLRRQLAARQGAAALLGAQGTGQGAGRAPLAVEPAEDVERQAQVLEAPDAPQAGEVVGGVDGPAPLAARPREEPPRLGERKRGGAETRPGGPR